MSVGGQHIVRGAGFLVALMGWLLTVHVYAAAAETHNYSIPAGSLDDSLHAFASQSGTQILYAPELTAHHRSDGLSGRFDANQALRRLLQGSGLNAIAVNNNTYVLKTAAPAPPLPSTAIPPIERVQTATKLMPVEVTGTHIRRTSLETASPLTIISHEEIEHSGYQTLYDLLRAQPGIRVSNAPVAMTDGAVYQNNGLSGATGAASVDLRGLGSAATLFLIDGQRMAGYGLAQDDSTTVNDLNSIPLALIERVEILRDGASAIYGSDAMAGVINVILRKTATGLSLTGSYGVSGHSDGRQRRFTASFGGQISHDGHALLSVDYLQRQPLLGAARSWNTQGPHKQDSTNGSATPGGDEFFLDGASVRHTADCSQQDPHANGNCVDDSARLTNLQTGFLSRSVLGHLDQNLGSVQAYADLRWTQVTQRQQMAPVKEDLWLPANHPDNKRHRGQTVYGYSVNDLGPVRDVTESTSNHLTLGLKGGLGEWDWDTHVNDQRNRSEDRLDGLIRTDLFARALFNGNYRFDGHNNPQLLAAISPTLIRHAHASQTGASLHLAGPLAQWSQGALSMALGVEAYRDRLSDTPDPLLLSNQVFQFQSPSARREDRWSSAAYMELSAPLTRSLEVDLAWRMDRSQGYGRAISPKFGVKWNLADSFSVRGTWAKGYRAPTLLQLSRPATLAATGFLMQVPNQILPCNVSYPADENTSFCEVRLNSVNNTQLRPETSHSYTFGMVWAPTSDMGIALDFYRIRRNNEITQLPVTYAVQHPGSYPQLFQRDRHGELYALNQQLVNLGHTDARTIDLDLRYGLQTAHYGHYALNLGVNYLARLNREVVANTPLLHYAGYASQPRWSALAGLEWRYRDWTTTANLRYTGHYRYAPYADSYLSCPDYLEQADKCNTPAFVLLDLNTAYSGFRHWTLALNVHNALNHSPVYYGTPGTAYNPLFDDVLGRYYLFSFTYRP
ncbi:TonB-dependent receptor [Dyella tabacisoli]|uniref:TonB-dependent receptor n=1 Tax=Dyella tabacisoli TaxID=2282381 RepID=A0A369UJB1_9GAMM|nr:TonB-dependent receptor [Dyella tabacisoli]RDD80631.1 TonB-dependent receptor [Dyella tabacisoli]